jgi:hypothetical protein
MIRVNSLQGKAGPGTLGISGSIDTSGHGLPVNLQITARNARLLVVRRNHRIPLRLDLCNDAECARGSVSK